MPDAVAPVMQAGARTLIVNDVRLWYCVAGNAASAATPVVYLHGGPGYASYSFAALVGARLERELRMVYFDQRGSGYSERPWTNDYSLARLVEDLEALRQVLRAERISLVGHSFGGTLALEYAAAHPERVGRLVLVSAAADLPAACRARIESLAERHPQELRAAQAQIKSQMRDCEVAFGALAGDAARQFNDAVMFPNADRRELHERIDARSGLRNTGELQRALFGAGLFQYRFTAADRLTMPVLVLAGEKDSAIGLPQQRALAASVANGHLEVYEGAGHFLYLDQPERFARDVIDFLSTPR